MEPTLKLSQEIATQLEGFFASDNGKQFVAEVKAAKSEESGTFEVIITTEDIDRMGEMIKADGWELDRYMLNPIVLWAHNYSELPIGITETLEKVDNTKLKAKGKFAGHQKAQEVRALYDAGIMRATSVGFIPKEMEGNIITKAELLEFSFVPVPCNPYALSTLSKTALNADELVAKGFLTKEEKKEGDTCQLPDEGGEGVIDAEGNCVPKEADEEDEEKGIVPAVKDIEVSKEKIVFVLENGEKVEHPIDAKLYEALAEIKEGRVLSKKNVALIEDCATLLGTAKSALEALLDASRSDEAPVIEEPEGKTREQGDEAFMKLRSQLQEVAGIVQIALKDAKTDALSKGKRIRPSN